MAVKCPGCNLLFSTRNEMESHVRDEHTRADPPTRAPSADDAPSPDADAEAGTAPQPPPVRGRRS